MPLTEAQRLAFLKGREKRMANIEKKKMEKAELEQLSGEPFTQEPEPEPVPEKPKVTRKPRKTKIPVDVKVELEVVKEDTVPDSKPMPTVEEEPPLQEGVSEKTTPIFDEDAIANKVVDMLLKKGVGVHDQRVEKDQVKPKAKKSRVTKSKPAEFQSPPPAPPTSTFTWL